MIPEINEGDKEAKKKIDLFGGDVDRLHKGASQGRSVSER